VRQSSAIIASTALLAALAGLTGCSAGGAGGRVVVRVARHAITQATVEHWIRLLAPGRVLPVPPRYTACITHQKGALLFFPWVR
jgi:hypothetical protein